MRVIDDDLELKSSRKRERVCEREIKHDHEREGKKTQPTARERERAKNIFHVAIRLRNF